MFFSMLCLVFLPLFTFSAFWSFSIAESDPLLSCPAAIASEELSGGKNKWLKVLVLVTGTSVLVLVMRFLTAGVHHLAIQNLVIHKQVVVHLLLGNSYN
jgi:hypothetical protein